MKHNGLPVALEPQVTLRNFYTFRTLRTLELALYHQNGKLPEPRSTQEGFLTSEKINDCWQMRIRRSTNDGDRRRCRSLCIELASNGGVTNMLLTMPNANYMEWSGTYPPISLAEVRCANDPFRQSEN